MTGNTKTRVHINAMSSIGKLYLQATASFSNADEKIQSLLGCRHRLDSAVSCFCHPRTSLDSLIPFPSNRILILPFVSKSRTHDVWGHDQDPKPGHERYVSVCAFVSNQIRASGLLQMIVYYAQHAADLVGVPIHHRVGLLFGVLWTASDECETNLQWIRHTKKKNALWPKYLRHHQFTSNATQIQRLYVRALAAHLEVQPRLGLEFLFGSSIAQFILLVIRLEEIFDYGTRFPNLDAGIWILDCRHSAVGVDGRERLSFDATLRVGEVEEVRFIRDVELVQNDCGFPWIRPLHTEFGQRCTVAYSAE